MPNTRWMPSCPPLLSPHAQTYGRELRATANGTGATLMASRTEGDVGVVGGEGEGMASLTGGDVGAMADGLLAAPLFGDRRAAAVMARW